MAGDSRSYHFNFVKDRFWIWAVLLPFGLICWFLPFVVLYGLMNTGLGKNTSAVIAFLFLGIPCYLVGWIFVYSLMEGIITRVTFTDTEIRYRTPNKMFPIFWGTKKVLKENINNIAMNVPYGTRAAIYLYYSKKSKRRNFYLPKFKNQPDYLKEFDHINDHLVQPLDSAEGSLNIR
jgi:hypothetical protein